MSRTASIADAEWLKDESLQRLLAILSSEGEESRIAGGAVRNALLGEPVADIDIAMRDAEQRVAHRAADDARLLMIAVEKRKQLRKLALFEPGRTNPLIDAGHFTIPGTSLPFSICAGT